MNIQQSFQILGLSRGASPGAAKSAYRKLVKTFHPDRFAHDPNGSRAAEETIKEINDAYGTVQSYFSSTSSIRQNHIKPARKTPPKDTEKTTPPKIRKKTKRQPTPSFSVKQNQTSFAQVFEQTLKSQNLRTTKTHDKPETPNTFRKTVVNHYSYAHSQASGVKPSGPVQEIKPVRPVPPIRQQYYS